MAAFVGSGDLDGLEKGIEGLVDAAAGDGDGETTLAD